MNKNIALISMITIPLVLSAAPPEVATGTQSFKMGDPNCDISRSGRGSGSSWSGMPGPGQTAPSKGGNMVEKNPEPAGDTGRMGGMNVGNVSWSGIPGGMMGYGPSGGMMGPSGENGTPDASSGGSVPGMGMVGPSGMSMGPPGIGQNQSGEENNSSGSNPGMGMNAPPGMGMGAPGMGYGPWGAGPYGGGMMMNQGNVHPSAIENRLDNIERRLDDLMRYIQNLPRN